MIASEVHPFLSSALITVLEDRGVKPDHFIALLQQDEAKVKTVDDSFEAFSKAITARSLGFNYQIPSILNSLSKLGLHYRANDTASRIDNPFLQELRGVAVQAMLRDVKTGRIEIPGSYYLLGVVDEGKTYVARGYRNVYTLKKNEIFGTTSFSCSSSSNVA